MISLDKRQENEINDLLNTNQVRQKLFPNFFRLIYFA
jgi:hypothetical protein